MKIIRNIILAISLIITITQAVTIRKPKKYKDFDFAAGSDMANLVGKLAIDLNIIKNLASNGEADCIKYEKHIQSYFNIYIQESKKKPDNDIKDIITCKFQCPTDNEGKAMFKTAVRLFTEQKKIGRILYGVVSESSKAGWESLKCINLSHALKNKLEKVKAKRIKAEALKKIDKIKKDPILDLLYNQKEKTKCEDYKTLINEKLVTMLTREGKVDEKCRMKCGIVKEDRISSDEVMKDIYIKDFFTYVDYLYKDNPELWIGAIAGDRKPEFEDCKNNYPGQDGEL